MRLSAYIMLFFILSCATHKGDANIAFSVLQQGQYGAEMAQQETLIQDAEQFEKIYQEVYSYQSPEPLKPQIDFNIKDVIFIHFGTFNYGGNVFNIQRVEQKDNFLFVHIQSPKKDKNTMVTTAITHPFAFIVMDKLAKKPDSIQIIKE